MGRRGGRVLLAWFPGQEFGNALADVLLGRRGARRPAADDLAGSEDGLPSTQPVDGALTYDEGLFIGYRVRPDGRAPRYPFGHGLGYTTGSYVSIDAPARAAGDGVPSTVRVRNTGDRAAGREVVQLYASRADSGVERPVALAGRASRRVDAGRRREVEAATVTRGAPGVRALG